MTRRIKRFLRRRQFAIALKKRLGKAWSKSNWSDPKFRVYVRAIMRQWLHCGLFPLPCRLGHHRIQLAMEWFGPMVVGCSCGRVFWKDDPTTDTTGDSLANPGHPRHMSNHHCLTAPGLLKRIALALEL